MCGLDKCRYRVFNTFFEELYFSINISRLYFEIGCKNKIFLRSMHRICKQKPVEKIGRFFVVVFTFFFVTAFLTTTRRAYSRLHYHMHFENLLFTCKIFFSLNSLVLHLTSISSCITSTRPRVQFYSIRNFLFKSQKPHSKI